MSLMKETGRDRYFEARDRELQALIDPKTGMLSERFARRIPCPVCGSGEHRQIFVKRGFTFVRCRVCSLVFANPQVDERLVVEEYRGGVSNDLWVDVLTSSRQLEMDRAKFEAIADELEPYRGRGRLLDVGCSIGLFLDIARARGWDGVGIEFGERALRYARGELGLEVLDVPLEDARLEPESFDAVALLSVLEHMNDPRSILRQIHRVLKPDGALYVITPNVESLACRLLHGSAATFDGRNHLVYFSPRTLGDALRREGFESQQVSTRVASLEPMLEWLSYREPYADEGTGDDAFAGWVRERATDVERLLNELHLGYKLHCLAVRR